MELYPILKDHYANSTFLANSSDEDKIDVGLMMLTMVSYALPKADLLKETFVKVIENITDPILSMNSLLLNCRLTIMLGYYMDILYKSDEKVFLGVIKMFLDSLTSGPENLALAHQSSDTLNTIINDNDIIPRIAPILPQLLERVSE